MTKCDFDNSFIIPLGNGAWEINPFYGTRWFELGDGASHYPWSTLSTSVNTKPDLETEKAREAFRKNFRSHLFEIEKCKTNNLPEIRKVIFNDPATIIIWADGTKTVVKCAEGDIYTKWVGFAFCVCKKIMGDSFHKEFKRWCGEDEIRSPIYDIRCSDTGNQSKSMFGSFNDELAKVLNALSGGV